MITELCNSGYQVLPEPTQQVTGTFFCLDSLFDDTLVFSPEQALALSSHRLVQEGCLVIQVCLVLLVNIPEKDTEMLYFLSTDIIID